MILIEKLVDGCHDLFRFRIFKQVAIGTIIHQVIDELFIMKHTDDQHFYSRVFFLDEAGGHHAIHHGHFIIHDHQIGYRDIHFVQ